MENLEVQKCEVFSEWDKSTFKLCSEVNINLQKYPRSNDEVDTLSVNSTLKWPFHLISRLNTRFIILLNVYNIQTFSENIWKWKSFEK